MTPHLNIGGHVDDAGLDCSHHFWRGDRVRLRPLRVEDAERAFADSLDSSTRRVLQLGIELPTSVELLRSSLERFAGCKDADGVVVFAIETLDGEYQDDVLFGLTREEFDAREKR